MTSVRCKLSPGMYNGGNSSIQPGLGTSEQHGKTPHPFHKIQPTPDMVPSARTENRISEWQPFLGVFLSEAVMVLKL